MTVCLDEEAVLSFCGGTMPADQRAAAFEHIGACDECRALVSATLQTSLVRSDDPATAATTPAEGLGSEMPPPSSMPAPVNPGDVLAGKYAVERILGNGGMGVVVAARHTQLGQLVALKFLLPSACETPGAIDRFLREGRAAAGITSEHVARVVDTGVLDSDAPYLVMEYLEGTDLAALIEKQGPIPAAIAIDYVLQACEAIVEAHQLGIIHRDIKPANLFLTRRKDGSPLVKVLDFGISKVEGGSRAQLTSTSSLMGSPRYMSPEQMLSAKDVDQRTDIWALGVVLFELVTGKPVWQADTVQGLCALITTAPAPRLRDLVPSAPAILEDVISRCLAKASSDRIPTIADLCLALAPIAAASSQTSVDRVLGVAGRTRPAVTTPPPTPPARKNRLVPIAALGLALGALAVFSIFQLRPSKPSEIASERPPVVKAALPAEMPSATPPVETAAPVLATAPSASAASRKADTPTLPSRTLRAKSVTPPRETATTPAPASPEPAAHPANDGTRALSDRK